MRQKAACNPTMEKHPASLPLEQIVGFLRRLNPTILMPIKWSLCVTQKLSKAGAFVLSLFPVFGFYNQAKAR
jgi:hypothetical protein